MFEVAKLNNLYQTSSLFNLQFVDMKTLAATFEKLYQISSLFIFQIVYVKHWQLPLRDARCGFLESMTCVFENRLGFHLKNKS